MMSTALLVMIAVIAAACAGDGGAGLAEGAQTALAFALIVLPILRMLGRSEDDPPHEG